MKQRIFSAVLALLLIVPTTVVLAQEPEQETRPAPEAVAEMRDVQGRVVGTATFATLQDGDVEIRVQVAGFEPIGGDHGIHIHAVGLCERPDFSSAGGHYNPTNAQHGFQNPEGPHAGDLPNIQFYPNGSADYRVTTNLFNLDELFDADGSALVIHSDADDYVTDPAGNSGDRIACGVITPSAAPEQVPAAEGSNGE